MTSSTTVSAAGGELRVSGEAFRNELEVVVQEKKKSSCVPRVWKFEILQTTGVVPLLLHRSLRRRAGLVTGGVEGVWHCNETKCEHHVVSDGVR